MRNCVSLTKRNKAAYVAHGPHARYILLCVSTNLPFSLQQNPIMYKLLSHFSNDKIKAQLVLLLIQVAQLFCDGDKCESRFHDP